MVKRGKKVSGFFFPSGESKKGEIDYKKKENFFSPLGSFLTSFGG